MRYEDCFYMRRCLELARKGAYYVAPNPMVGAVLVKNTEYRVQNTEYRVQNTEYRVQNTEYRDKIVSEGWHMRYGGPHAEVNCLGQLPEDFDYSDTTLYVSLEPCSHWGKTPPCADLIIRKGIPRVVVGMQDPNPLVSGQGIARLRAHGIEVVVGVLEAECRELNKRFLCLQEKHRPYVILKWAETADGYMDYKRESVPGDGGENTKPLVISNKVTKQLVHQMRAENMAILVGSGTALKDNPRLATTHWIGRNPIRVLLDRRGRVGSSHRLFNDDAETLVYRGDGGWPEVLRMLAERNIHSVLVEGGPTVLNAILADGTWDEMHVEVAPVRIGDGVKAPEVTLPKEAEEEIEGNRLYCVKNG